jgi:Zn ribbon nucleic-acid-binding protein
MASPAKPTKRPFATARRVAGSLYQTSRWTKTSKAFLAGRACVDCGTTLRLQADHEPAWQPNEGIEAFYDMRRLVARCHAHHASKSGRDASSRAHTPDPAPRLVTWW